MKKGEKKKYNIKLLCSPGPFSPSLPYLVAWKNKNKTPKHKIGKRKKKMKKKNMYSLTETKRN